MPFEINGGLANRPTLRVGYIGCGSHSFRNVLPTLQYLPVELAAVSDLDVERAKAYSRAFGAERAYGGHRQMLENESLDAVLIVVGTDEAGRPLYPSIVPDCLEAGCHVWIEKPAAATTEDLEPMRTAAEKTGKNVMVGYKNMFCPANGKAKALMARPGFGEPISALFQKSYLIPTKEQFDEYLGKRRPVKQVHNFVDHLCHPMSTVLYLLGRPKTLYYQTNRNTSGFALFTWDSGLVACMYLSAPAPAIGGDEKTMVVSSTGKQVRVENNIRVFYEQGVPLPGYGRSPDFFQGEPGEAATSMWEPEFCRANTPSKDLFLIGFYAELLEFVTSALEGRSPDRGTLDDAWMVSRVFEAFAEGPGRLVEL